MTGGLGFKVSGLGFKGGVVMASDLRSQLKQDAV